MWPLSRAALITVLVPIGDGVKEAGRGREKSGKRAKSKRDNDMLQCVILSQTVVNVKGKLTTQIVLRRRGLSSP